MALAAVALSGPSATGAHPEHLVEPITVEDFGYSPAAVTILQGRSVQWRWQNSIPHSVSSVPGSAFQFDSGMHVSGDHSFVLRFDQPGSYRYVSKSPSARIAGTIEVLPLPGQPPRIRGLSVRGKVNPLASFRLNKRAYLVARVQDRKRGSWRTRKTLSRHAVKGHNRIRISGRRLEGGRYRLELSAYDRQRREGNAHVRFRLR